MIFRKTIFSGLLVLALLACVSVSHAQQSPGPSTSRRKASGVPACAGMTKSAHERQATAQAVHNFSHCSIPAFPLQFAAHASHASAHARQATMQALNFSFSILI